jgi:hypothetical protein
MGGGLYHAPQSIFELFSDELGVIRIGNDMGDDKQHQFRLLGGGGARAEQFSKIWNIHQQGNPLQGFLFPAPYQAAHHQDLIVLKDDFG